MAAGGILTLDIAGVTGWAYGLPGTNRLESGTWVLPPPTSYGRTYAALGNELADAIALHQPGLVVVEAPLVRQDRSARLLLGLVAHAESTCYRWEIECREQAVATVRKGVLGRGTFPKDTAKAHVLAWCRENGHRVVDDNEADAVLLWAFACKNLATARMKRLVAQAA